MPLRLDPPPKKKNSIIQNVTIVMSTKCSKAYTATGVAVATTTGVCTPVIEGPDHTLICHDQKDGQLINPRCEARCPRGKLTYQYQDDEHQWTCNALPELSRKEYENRTIAHFSGTSMYGDTRIAVIGTWYGDRVKVVSFNDDLKQCSYDQTLASCFSDPLQTYTECSTDMGDVSCT